MTFYDLTSVAMQDLFLFFVAPPLNGKSNTAKSQRASNKSERKLIIPDTHPLSTKEMWPGAKGSFGSVDMVTCSNLTNFQADSVLIDALSCSLVPMGTAWSRGTWSNCWSSWGLESEDPSSLYSATSYSRLPGDSSTTPDTLAAGGLN